MKKLAFILCFVYVVASSGATINFHYCMGKFIGWDVSAPIPATCNNCSMQKEKAKGCCNDKHATLQLKTDHLSSSINNVPNIYFVCIHPQYSSFINSIISVDDNVAHSIHGPPFIQSIPSFIRNCVFRI